MTQVVWTPKANESYTSEEREITRPGTPACTGLGQFKKSPANSPARGGGHFVRLLEAAPDASAIGAAKITANRGMTVLQTVAQSTLTAIAKSTSGSAEILLSRVLSRLEEDPTIIGRVWPRLPDDARSAIAALLLLHLRPGKGQQDNDASRGGESAICEDGS